MTNSRKRVPGKRGRPFPPGNKAGRKFVKGQPGGPGRPPLPPGFKAALNAIEPHALMAIDEIVRDAKHKDRRQAAEYVLNQKHGKPKERTEISGPDGAPIEVKTAVTTDDRRKRVTALMEAARARLASKVDKPPADDDPPSSE